jgi:hypothetical protein
LTCRSIGKPRPAAGVMQQYPDRADGCERMAGRMKDVDAKTSFAEVA